MESKITIEYDPTPTEAQKNNPVGYPPGQISIIAPDISFREKVKYMEDICRILVFIIPRYKELALEQENE